MSTTFRVSLVLVFLATIGLATGAKASLQTGDILTIGNGPGTPGGIFYLQDTSSNKIADTFCVDLFEYIRFDRTYQVANAFATATVAGNRPLTSFAAWLFDRYLNGVEGGGPVLPNFDFTNTYGQISAAAARIQANELQLAIWIAIGYTPAEIGGVGSGWYSAYDDKLAGWQAAFGSDLSWSGTGNIYIANLLGRDSSGNYTVHAQDQLVRNVIPEPLSALVWLVLGITAAGAIQLHRNGNPGIPRA